MEEFFVKNYGIEVVNVISVGKLIWSVVILIGYCVIVFFLNKLYFGIWKCM